jgi:hypothetical protein
MKISTIISCALCAAIAVFGVSMTAGNSLPKVTISNAPAKSTSASSIKKIPATTYAYFQRPQGYLFSGISSSFNTSSDSVLLGPAFVEANWVNKSENETAYEWKYADPANASSTLTATTAKFATNYPNGTFAQPVLTANNGTETSVYKIGNVLQSGGNCGVYGASPADYNKGLIARSGFYGFVSYGQYMWATIFSGHFYTTSTCEGIANYYEAPLQPYTVSKVWIMGIIAETSGFNGKLTAVIRKASRSSRYSGSQNNYPGDTIHTQLAAEMTLGDTIATATATKSDTTKYTDGNGNKWCCFSFKFKNKAGQDTLITINSSVLVAVTGLDKLSSMGVNSYYPFLTNTDVKSLECPGCVMLKQIDSTGVIHHNVYPTTVISFKDNTTGDYNPDYSAFTIFTDANFPWLQLADSTYAAPASGGSKSFDFNTSYASPYSELKVSYSNASDTSWVSSKFEATSPAITFTVAELPTGVSSRNTDATIASTCVSGIVHITQVKGDGVNSLSTSKGVFVKTVGDNFEVSYPSNVNYVRVFNVAGQTVAAQALNAQGSATIPAAGHGVYIFKFSDGETLKVIK